MCRQIKEILRREVAEGIADPEKPMTEAQLLSRFDVSRAPIRQALQELASEGLRLQKARQRDVPGHGHTGYNDRPTCAWGLCTNTSPTADFHPTGKVSGIERVEPHHARSGRA
ncbi:GntR family transcriptional regulator [Pseudarthrobacter sp. H2]|uniref:GntR family transcriptional regulator n=1 Tax=Pseudarthrobacter sp. H2 TaxID=3418415 RepID=UPI003CF7335D